MTGRRWSPLRDTPITRHPPRTPGGDPAPPLSIASLLRVVLSILAIAFALPAARFQIRTDVPIGRPGRRPRRASRRHHRLARSRRVRAITYYHPARRRFATRSATGWCMASISVFASDCSPYSSPPVVARFSSHMLDADGTRHCPAGSVPLTHDDLAPPTGTNDLARLSPFRLHSLPITAPSFWPAIALVCFLKREVMDPLRRRPVSVNHSNSAGACTTIAALLRSVVQLDRTQPSGASRRAHAGRCWPPGCRCWVWGRVRPHWARGWRAAGRCW